MKVHISGFGPFGNEKTNPTARLIEDLDGYRVEGASIQLHLLPATVEGIRSYVQSLVKVGLDDDTVVIAFGLANGRRGMAVERVAINCFDFPILRERFCATDYSTFFNTIPSFWGTRSGFIHVPYTGDIISDASAF